MAANVHAEVAIVAAQTVTKPLSTIEPLRARPECHTFHTCALSINWVVPHVQRQESMSYMNLRLADPCVKKNPLVHGSSKT